VTVEQDQLISIRLRLEDWGQLEKYAHVGEHLAVVVNLLDQIVLAGQMIRYSVQPNKLGDRNWGECQPKHERILIHPTGPTIRLTLVHEIGHALDHGLGIAFGLGDDHFASSSDPSFKALNNAIEASRRIETIRDYKSRYPPGTVGHDSAQIYLTPEECFARAFTQWVVRTSNDECLSCQLEEKIEHPDSIPIHWDADDFDPIVHLVDALLSEKGLRR
jgi:hypothetical protein